MIDQANIDISHAKAADKKAHGVVFTADAFHHGPGGIMVSVDRSSDIVHDGVSDEDFQAALDKKMNEAEQTWLLEAKKKLEEVRLEKEIAGQMAHNLEMQKEIMRRKLSQEEKLKSEMPTIVAKQTVPVVVYPRDGFPFSHHIKILLANIQDLRRHQLGQIQAQQKHARLDDITEELAAGNPGTDDPARYKNLLVNVPGANQGLYEIPVSPHNGSFLLMSHHDPHADQDTILPVPSSAKSADVPHSGMLGDRHIPVARSAGRDSVLG